MVKHHGPKILVNPSGMENCILDSDFPHYILLAEISSAVSEIPNPNTDIKTGTGLSSTTLPRL